MMSLRKLWRAALGLVAAGAIGLPAWATPGVWSVVATSPPLAIAFINQNNGSATTAFATSMGGNACPASGLMVVWVRHSAAAVSVTSVTDSQGNTYALVDQQTTAPGTVFAYAKGITGLTGGNSVTVNTGATSGTEDVALACVTGAQTGSPLDASGNNVTGTGNTLSTASGALAQANEAVFGGVAFATSATTGTSCNGSFSRLTNGGSTGVMLCSQIVAATTSVSFAPSWAAGTSYSGDVVSFKGWP